MSHEIIITYVSWKDYVHERNNNIQIPKNTKIQRAKNEIVPETRNAPAFSNGVDTNAESWGFSKTTLYYCQCMDIGL